MAGYSITSLEDVPDVTGDYPGEMRMAGGSIGADQVAFTWRRMPAGTGGKGSYGHRHRTQEEVYYVVSGRLEFKVGDDVFEVGAGDAVRVAADAWRSVWNEGPDDAELLIVSIRSADPEHETEMLADFWPE